MTDRITALLGGSSLRAHLAMVKAERSEDYSTGYCAGLDRGMNGKKARITDHQHRAFLLLHKFPQHEEMGHGYRDGLALGWKIAADIKKGEN